MELRIGTFFNLDPNPNSFEKVVSGSGTTTDSLRSTTMAVNPEARSLEYTTRFAKQTVPLQLFYEKSRVHCVRNAKKII
jgi:hypothetical protein